MLKIQLKGDGLEKFAKAVKVLGEAKAQSAFRMALNDSRKQVYTQVKRVLAVQMGVSQQSVIKHGGIKQVPASGGKLSTSINSTGATLPLSDFKPSRGGAGVKANPWGDSHVFPGTFMIGRFGNHVFKRTDKFNKVSGRFNGFEKLWGPSVPKEMVKDESAAAFDKVSSEQLPKRVAHHLKRLSGGVIS